MSGNSESFFQLVIYFCKQLLMMLVPGLLKNIYRIPRFAEFTFKTIEFLLFHTPIILRFSFLWKYILRQKWQFSLERAYHIAGKPRVHDPLFFCDFTPHEILQKSGVSYSGFFNIDFVYNGLLVTGVVKSKECNTVEFLLDDRIIKKLNLKKNSNYRSFKIKFMRNVIENFPKESVLTIKCDDENFLLYKKSHGVKLIVPHGNCSLLRLLDAGSKISKKGTFTATADETRKKQNSYLDIYDKAKVAFDTEIGKPLFLMYGTLLGFYRENDFIPGDDDFDVGYISDKTNPEDVKEEAKKIMIKLIQAGFTVTFNRKGRLFRLQTGRGGGGNSHLDLRPLWFEDGFFWGGKQTKILCTKDDLLPVEKGILRGHEVYIPQKPDVILSRYYGPGWRVPDPGYVNDRANIDKYIKKNLNRALITPMEYFKIKNFLEKNEVNIPGMGRFISTSLQNLYPLDEFIE